MLSPTAWYHVQMRTRVNVTPPPTWAEETGLTLALYPLWPLPDLPQAAVAQLVERDLPPGARARTLASADETTDLGARMVVIDAQVTGADGAVIEERLGALYHFLEYAGGAMFRGSRARLDEHRAQILAILASGRADFSGEVAALEQLGTGLDQEGSWVRY